MSKAKELLEQMLLGEDTKKDRMYSKIQKHGEQLNAIFKTDLDPITLCKRLRSLEYKMSRAATQYSNGDMDSDEEDKIEQEILGKVDKLLGFKAKKIPVFINSDPRGYALKIDDDWVRNNRDKTPIYSDFGGYGILAPDFTEG